jgi:hypothetical protein
MKTSRDEVLTGSFVLTPHDLSGLHDHLRKWITNFSFKTDNQDSLSREFSTLKDLLQFENPPQKNILSLRILGYSTDFKTKFSIVFSGEASRNISISIAGDEEAVASMSASFDETLAAVRPWYSLLGQANFYAITYAIVLVPAAVIVFSVAFGIVKLTSSRPVDAVYVMYSVMKGLSLGMLPPILGFVFHQIQRKVFPMGVFAIGQGAKRHKDRETIRTVVVVAFTVSLVSSIVAGLLFTLWR